LKYLYLLFEDENVIPLDGELLVKIISACLDMIDAAVAVAVAEYVLNTEAHPLPVFMPNHPLADF